MFGFNVAGFKCMETTRVIQMWTNSLMGFDSTTNRQASWQIHTQTHTLVLLNLPVVPFISHCPLSLIEAVVWHSMVDEQISEMCYENQITKKIKYFQENLLD